MKAGPQPGTRSCESTKTQPGLKKADLSFEVNESDGYALEEALRIKEKVGGEVVAVPWPAAREERDQRCAGARRRSRHPRTWR